MKCIAVDDEPFALELITGYISKTPYLELQGAFSNPVKALSFLMVNSVDLVFLDINMPELNGLQMLKSLRSKPMIVFTTAYSEYGVESYEYDAIDYLLKPIKYERFLRAVNKAIDIGRNTHDTHLGVEAVKDAPQVILLKSGTQLFRISVGDILFVEAAGNYMTFHTVDRKILSLLTMKEVMEQLPADMFVRVHKSFVVSLRHIDIVERHQVKVRGVAIPIGLTYREQFQIKYGIR